MIEQGAEVAKLKRVIAELYRANEILQTAGGLLRDRTQPGAPGDGDGIHHQAQKTPAWTPGDGPGIALQSATERNTCPRELAGGGAPSGDRH